MPPAGFLPVNAGLPSSPSMVATPSSIGYGSPVTTAAAAAAAPAAASAPKKKSTKKKKGGCC
ncbi:unnamed protein product [Polarella glacialis]|uniref:Uncharacterized protein n=1 Tax=Polarella glacialis TaxID=89957 RepID=A0A813EHM7_POLGL|nr:unnamed protein product [Polarella glacialis]CAE8623573.1 unnamed protein product [Polarella glacialis]